MKTRVRYAPSPTGLQHIGGVRTAIFNYLFARSTGGTFILRVEDTDQARTTPEAMNDLFETLEWLGIEPDEGPTGQSEKGDFGPYIQSCRQELYKKYAEQLVSEGKAYRCYCTSDRLDALRAEQKANKSSVIGYDGHCRTLTPEQEAELAKKNPNPVIRFKIDPRGSTTFHDELMGDITRKHKDISPDPVMLKADGFPTYHLANVIDDHLMGITHILRAQEWIPSGPLHVLLYEAFGWEPPKYCHLPMVMGKDGQKLSKRHGSTSVIEFRKQGCLPEALLNYVSLVGWSYDGEREFFTKSELEQLFTLEKINTSPGVFDYKKLEWFNGQYIRKLSESELKQEVLPYLQNGGLVQTPPTTQEQSMLNKLIPLIHERLKYLSDVVPMSRFLFQEIETPSLEELTPKKGTPRGVYQALEVAEELVPKVSTMSEDELNDQFRAKAEELGLKLGSLMMPLRIAVSGSSVSPPLFGSIELLGLEKAMERIQAAKAVVEKGLA